MKDWLSWLLLILVGALVAGQFIFFQKPDDILDVRIKKIDWTERDVRISFKANSRSSKKINFRVAALTSPNPLPDKLYVFYDPSYTTLLTSVKSYRGLIDHLGFELKVRKLPTKLEVLDAAGLARVMTTEPDSWIVVGSGVLPGTVWGPEQKLVVNWLSGGGHLVWIGDGLGYYFGKKEEKIEANNNPPIMGWTGQREILGVNLLEGNYFANLLDSLAETPSDFARIFNLRYSFTRTGPIIKNLLAGGGLPLGTIYSQPQGEDRTSIGIFKVGRGEALLFGSGLVDREWVVASDLAQILWTQVSEKSRFASQDFTVDPKGDGGGQISIGTEGLSSNEVLFSVFSTASWQNFWWKTKLTNKSIE